jgi:hypothetical protein
VAGGNVAGGATWDARRDLFYVAGSGVPGGVNSYDPNTQTFASAGRATNTGNYVFPFVDHRRDCLIFFTSTLRPTLFKVARLSSSGEGGTSVTTTGTIPPDAEPGSGIGRGAGSIGIAHDALRDRYLLWQGGTTIYTLTPPALGVDPLAGTWTWGTLAPLSGSVTPGAQEFNGTYNRFWFSESLNAVGVFNTTFQKMHVFALENV